MHIVIPMSGLGSRFAKEGYNDPKPLIRVRGKPMIEHIVNLFPGETKFSFICNNQHLANTDMRNILTAICSTSTIYEVDVNDRKGPVHAVSQIFDKINDDEEVIVSYCDYGTVWDYCKFLKEIRERGTDGAIAFYTGFHPHMLRKDNYAYSLTDDNGYLISIKEKEPWYDDKLKEKASNGCYYFKSGSILKKYFKKFMDDGITINGEFYVSLVYNYLVEDGLKVYLFEIDKMLQWGTPTDLEDYIKWGQYFDKLKLSSQPEYPDPFNTTLILPMAGKGSRFSLRGFETPKPLLDVNGVPMFIEAVRQLPATSEKIFICQDEHNKKYRLSDTVTQYFENSKIMAIDHVTEGQACTCVLAIDKFNIKDDSPILISACDNGIYYDHDEYQKLLLDDNNDVIVFAFKDHESAILNPNMYAWLEVDQHNYLIKQYCKEFIFDDPRKYPAIIGTMFFRKAKYFNDGLKRCYDKNIRTNGEFYVDNILNENVEMGLRVKVFVVDNYLCWGTPNDYLTYKYWYEHF